MSRRVGGAGVSGGCPGKTDSPAKADRRVGCRARWRPRPVAQSASFHRRCACAGCCFSCRPCRRSRPRRRPAPLRRCASSVPAGWTVWRTLLLTAKVALSECEDWVSGEGGAGGHAGRRSCPWPERCWPCRELRRGRRRPCSLPTSAGSAWRWFWDRKSLPYLRWCSSRTPHARWRAHGRRPTTGSSVRTRVLASSSSRS